jgi:hypothetical protein
MLATFDANVFSETCPLRSSTTTPLQALAFMNSDLVNEEAGFLAARVRRDAGEDRGAQIRRLFEIALNREPEKEETDRLLRLDRPLDVICRIVLSTNEMLYVE